MAGFYSLWQGNQKPVNDLFTAMQGPFITKLPGTLVLCPWVLMSTSNHLLTIYRNRGITCNSKRRAVSGDKSASQPLVFLGGESGGANAAGCHITTLPYCHFFQNWACFQAHFQDFKRPLALKGQGGCLWPLRPPSEAFRIVKRDLQVFWDQGRGWHFVVLAWASQESGFLVMLNGTILRYQNHCPHNLVFPCMGFFKNKNWRIIPLCICHSNLKLYTDSPLLYELAISFTLPVSRPFRFQNIHSACMPKISLQPSNVGIFLSPHRKEWWLEW